MTKNESSEILEKYVLELKFGKKIKTQEDIEYFKKWCENLKMLDLPVPIIDSPEIRAFWNKYVTGIKLRRDFEEE